jgi:NAD(P)-dependent dehydrogenase (short-subunit alcohol dehydrogenase family)
MSDAKKVCLILGAGAGIGGNTAKRFAKGGYHTVLARRSDEEGLNRLVSEIEAEGGSASGVLIDAVQDGTIEELVEAIERDIGPIEVCLFNLGAQIGNRPFFDTPHKAFELGWRMTSYALFRLGQAMLPKMLERGRGVLLVTSATSAMRGNAGQHSHAAAIGGRRMLCQTLNAEFAPQGIHVSHIVVDGPVDAPDTLGRLLGDKFEAYKSSKGEDGVLDPAALAETYWHLAHQHRSCWSFEVDVRPWTDAPWWNDNPPQAINTSSRNPGKAKSEG